MGMVVIKIKIMPESPETDLKKIEKTAEDKIKSLDKVAKVHEIQEEPIAFGLVAVIITLLWPEDKNPDLLEEAMRGIADVNSAEIIDVRRLL